MLNIHHSFSFLQITAYIYAVGLYVSESSTLVEALVRSETKAISFFMDAISYPYIYYFASHILFHIRTQYYPLRAHIPTKRMLFSLILCFFTKFYSLFICFNVNERVNSWIIIIIGRFALVRSFSVSLSLCLPKTYIFILRQ